MAKRVLTDCWVEIDGTEVTDNVSKAEVDDTFEDKDTTTYGDNGAKTRLAGLEDGSFPVTFKNDFAAGQLDSFMWSKRKQLVTVRVKPDKNQPCSSSNPIYFADILINAWKPISGSVGDVAEVDVTFPVSGGWDRTDTT
jgi:hypothetical protein